MPEPKYKVTSKDFFGKKVVKSGLTFAEQEREYYKHWPHDRDVKVELEPGTGYTPEEEAKSQEELYKENIGILKGFGIPF